MTVLLVRHGETTWNRRGRVQGWAPTELTDRGRRQARALAAGLAGEYDVDRLVASDLRRTRQTAAPVADALGIDPTFDRRWRERDVGVYQGLPRERVLRERDMTSVVGIDDAPESGESLAAVRDRVVAAFEDVRATAAGDTVAVVTHGGPIRLAVAHVSDLDPVVALDRYSPDNCSVWTVSVGDGVTLERENETYPPDAHSADG